MSCYISTINHIVIYIYTKYKKNPPNCPEKKTLQAIFQPYLIQSLGFFGNNQRLEARRRDELIKARDKLESQAA